MTQRPIRRSSARRRRSPGSIAPCERPTRNDSRTSRNVGAPRRRGITFGSKASTRRSSARISSASGRTAICPAAAPIPILSTETLVFDLSTGERVDWRKLLPAQLRGAPGGASAGRPVATDRLAGADGAVYRPVGKGRRRRRLQGGVRRAGDEFRVLARRQGERAGDARRQLAALAEGPCSGPVTIPIATLKSLGFDALPIEDVETGGIQFADP